MLLLFFFSFFKKKIVKTSGRNSSSFFQCLNSPHFFTSSGGDKRVNYSVNSSRNRPSQSVLLSTPINRASQCLLPRPPPLLSGYSYIQFPKFSPKILLFSHNVLSRNKAERINGRRVLKLSFAIWCRKIEAFYFLKRGAIFSLQFIWYVPNGRWLISSDVKVKQVPNSYTFH